MPKLKRIELHLARAPGFPEGSAERGYVIIAGLTDDGHLAPGTGPGRVRRFWQGHPTRHGRLVHHGSGWTIDFDSHSKADDAKGFRLATHVFREGEYVTFTSGEESLAFRIASVTDAAAGETP